MPSSASGGASVPVTRVHAVIVAYNSAPHAACLRDPAARRRRARDGRRQRVARRHRRRARGARRRRCSTRRANGGFAAGCNLGARRGDAPYVLLLNPDAAVGEEDLATLVRVLDEDPRAGARRAAHHRGRRQPRLQPAPLPAAALDLRAGAVRCTGSGRTPPGPTRSSATRRLRRPGVAGLGVRRMHARSAATARAPRRSRRAFFLYCEDIDLCARLREAGWDVRFEPAAIVRHNGGASRPTTELLPVLARSRVALRAQAPAGTLAVPLETCGIALGARDPCARVVRRPARRARACRGAGRRCVAPRSSRGGA